MLERLQLCEGKHGIIIFVICVMKERQQQQMKIENEWENTTMRSSDWFLSAKNKLINSYGTFVFDRFLCSVSLFVLIRYDVPVSSDAFIRKEIFWYFSSWKGKA